MFNVLTVDIIYLLTLVVGCRKQNRYVKFKGTMTKWPVQKPTHRTTQKHVEHHDVTDI